jgi:protease-4
MNFLKKLFSPITFTLKFIQEYFKSMLFLLLLFLLFAPQSDQELHSNNLQEIKLVGVIMDSTEVVNQINKAASNKAIKGVLFTVDSPGGAVAPSIEIAYAIKRLRKSKPVVVYAKGTIASGSYYSSIWADKIIANPGSMVGSIGVIMEGTDLSGIMEKIGIKTQVVKAGKYKQIGTPDREWKPFEIAELNKVIQGTYDMFTRDVANARKLDYKKRDIYANAHIFTAYQAQKVGLIDDISDMYGAKEQLRVMSRLKKSDVIWNKEDKFDKFIKSLAATSAVTLQTYFPSLVLR